MRLILFLILLPLTSAAQTLPAAPSHQKQFWAVHAIWYATILADGAVSAKASSGGWPCAREGNAMYRNRYGSFSAGKYWAINIPSAFAITLLDHKLARKWRPLGIILPLALGYSHGRQAASWAGC